VWSKLSAQSINLWVEPHLTKRAAFGFYSVLAVHFITHSSGSPNPPTVSPINLRSRRRSLIGGLPLAPRGFLHTYTHKKKKTKAPPFAACHHAKPNQTSTMYTSQHVINWQSKCSRRALFPPLFFFPPPPISPFPACGLHAHSIVCPRKRTSTALTRNYQMVLHLYADESLHNTADRATGKPIQSPRYTPTPHPASCPTTNARMHVHRSWQAPTSSHAASPAAPAAPRGSDAAACAPPTAGACGARSAGGTCRTARASPWRAARAGPKSR
jgi:hypothetical protein